MPGNTGISSFRQIELSIRYIESLYSLPGQSHPSLLDRVENIAHLPTKPDDDKPFLSLSVDRYRLAQFDWQMTEFLRSIEVGASALYARGVDAIHKDRYTEAVACLSEVVALAEIRHYSP